LAQVAFDAGMHAAQPQVAGRRLLQQPHPDVEHRRGDLVVVVEAAENEPILGKAKLATRRRALSNEPGGIAYEVAVRQVNDFLRVNGCRSNGSTVRSAMM
jgi:hypothetical protein